MKTSVRRIHSLHGWVWRVTYGCGCEPRQFRCWHVALIFATSHRCPSIPGALTGSSLGPRPRSECTEKDY